MNVMIQNMLQHTSVRKFKIHEPSTKTIEILIDVAQHASSSNFQQSYSVIQITNLKIKENISKIARQDYITEIPCLFVFVVDLYRNLVMSDINEKDTVALQSTDYFLRGLFDSTIGAQNMLVAAENLGMGGVFLGSILNDSDKMIELLKLPPYTFPVFGLGIGTPDEQNSIRPRLPKEVQFFENTYPNLQKYKKHFEDYDKKVQEYYQERMSRTGGNFSGKLKSDLKNQTNIRKTILNSIHEQGMLMH